MMGAAIFGFGISSLLGWRETEWIKVKIIVQVEIVWLTVGIIMLFIGAFMYFPPIFIWFIIAIFIAALIAFCLCYYLQEKK